MRRIFSYNLALLFYFLQGKTLSVPYIDKRISEEALDSMVDNLEDIVNDSKHPLFNKEVQNGCYIISVLEAQKHILKNYLEKYCTELVNDQLETRNQNVCKWSFVREEFKKRLAPYNLNCFIDSNIYDMPQLAPELIKLHDNGGYTLEIEINANTECINEKSFSFKCFLNLSNILKDKIKSEPATVEEQEESRRTKFQPQQQKLYNYLDNKAKSGKFSFAKYDLSALVQIKGNKLSSAINRLNTQYQEIYNTEEKLIKYDRAEGVYILNNVWNYNTSD